ncbi:cytochrome c oxidase assembly protein [Heyndrickxia sporothermodurans]
MLYFILFLKGNWQIKKLQLILFISGIGLLYLLTGTPLSIFSYISFSTHMLQISLLFFILPPILLLSFPKKIFQRTKLTIIKKIDPYIFIVLFAFFLYIYHSPSFLQLIMEKQLGHDLFIWLMFLLSMLMWIPIIIYKATNCVYLEQSYLTINVWLITPSCILFILLPPQTGNPLLNQMLSLCFPPNSNINLIKPLINIRIDQQIAGMLMFFMHKIGISLADKIEVSLMNNHKSIKRIDFFFKDRF